MESEAGDLNRLAPALDRLRRRLAEPGLADTDDGWLLRESRVRLAVLETRWAWSQAVAGGAWATWARARHVAGAELKALLDDRPGHWQGRELQARLLLGSLKAPSDASSAALSTTECAQALADLQPAVDAGQAGVVLEAWIAANRCVDPLAASGPWISRLVSGGYVPSDATLVQPRP